MPVIGFVRSTSAANSTHLVTAFRQGLKEAGFVEGQNVAVEYRWADNQFDRLPALVADCFAGRWPRSSATSIPRLRRKLQPPRSRSCSRPGAIRSVTASSPALIGRVATSQVSIFSAACWARSDWICCARSRPRLLPSVCL